MQIKKDMSIPELQEYIADMKKRRKFRTELEREFILLSEEVGEFAREMVKGVWKSERMGATREDAFSQNRKKLGEELADILIYVLSLANVCGVDLDSALVEKEKFNETRDWDKILGRK